MATKGGCGIRAQRKRASRKWKGSVQRAFNCVVIGSQRRIYLDSQGLLGVQRTNRKSTENRKRNQTLIVNRRLIISCPFPWSKSWMLAWHFTFYFKLKKKMSTAASSLVSAIVEGIQSLESGAWKHSHGRHLKMILQIQAGHLHAHGSSPLTPKLHPSCSDGAWKTPQTQQKWASLNIGCILKQQRAGF